MGKKKTVTKKSASKPELGRGKKMCPKCNKVSGVRTQVCECGHKFIAKKKAAPKKKAQVPKKTDLGSVLKAQKAELQQQIADANKKIEAIDTLLD